MAGGIDGAQLAEDETFALNFGQQAHALGDVVAGAPEIYEVSAGAQVGCGFDDGGSVAVVDEPVGESGAGNSRAGNQNAHRK